MSFAPIENTVAAVDGWTLSFDKIPADTEAEKNAAVQRLAKRWDAVKSDVDGQAGLKLQKPDLQALVEAMIKGKSHAIMFDLVLTRSEFRLDVQAGNTTVKCGSVKVPSELEEYRNFIANLNGWSQGDHDLVPDSDFKAFNAKNPPAPPKPAKYKDFDEMTKKNVKADVEAFRAWAKTKKKAALDDIDKTAKAKPTDAARVAALKAINAALVDYQKTF